MSDIKEKLHQAGEKLKQAKTKIDPYIEKVKPYLHKAKELTIEGMISATTKANQLKENYLRKKAAEKAKDDTKQPPKA